MWQLRWISSSCSPSLNFTSIEPDSTSRLKDHPSYGVTASTLSEEPLQVTRTVPPRLTKTLLSPSGAGADVVGADRVGGEDAGGGDAAGGVRVGGVVGGTVAGSAVALGEAEGGAEAGADVSVGNADGVGPATARGPLPSTWTTRSTTAHAVSEIAATESSHRRTAPAA